MNLTMNLTVATKTARTPRAVERLCPTCHGDCYVATERGERRCPRCKATGIVVEVSA